MSENLSIDVHGARTHNLRDIDVAIPRGQLTVITGVSGSGKSSLAFHTLHAEGQRRFLKTLSGRVHPWLDQLPRPDVDAIRGLPPVIAVRQEGIRPHVRSTVANVTEILDYLRVLFARAGTVYCPDCQLPVRASSPQQIVEMLLAYPGGTKMMLLAPVLADQTGTHQERLERIGRDGFVRARIDGEIVDLSERQSLDLDQPHTIEIVVDRLILKPDIRTRLAESVEQTLRLGEGRCLAVLERDGRWQDVPFQQELCCSGCGQRFPELEPALFSWATAKGACPECAGTGRKTAESVPQQPAGRGKGRRSPGSGGASVASPPSDSDNLTVIAEICEACQGSRLNRLAAQVRLAETTLPQILARTLPDVQRWLHELPSNFPDSPLAALVSTLTKPLLYRLDFLLAVGVAYLSLDRSTGSLSGGELQRVRLARCLGTQLQGSCYVLDEPTSGLHHRDISPLLQVLQQLTVTGNTVVCVEHHLNIVAAADHVIEMGPAGGRGGGEVLFAGPPIELARRSDLPTGRALANAEQLRTAAAEPRISIASVDSAPGATAVQDNVTLSGATLHNLRGDRVELPLNQMICVSGVSGSGKSTLILDCLAPLLQQALGRSEQQAEQGSRGSLVWSGEIRSVAVVDHFPPRSQSRTCPATYSGMWDHVRGILARTRLARMRGYDRQRFRLQGGAGNCEQCQGRGEVELEGTLLKETRVTCPLCAGRRFNPVTLSVHFREKSIVDLLRMTVDEAVEFWSEFEPLVAKIRPLQEIGLGYLSLGQSARSLSGGESQRMKLARALTEPAGQTVYILDEPTSGLHWEDVSRLIRVLRNIVAAGNTVIVIEHHPLLLAAGDWEIEMGPDAGQQGGGVQYCGVQRHPSAENPPPDVPR